MSSVERVVGPPCKLCHEPEYVVTTVTPDPLTPPNGVVNDAGRAHAAFSRTRVCAHHECKRTPEKVLTWLLDRIGSWTDSRWDQHARSQYGDEAVNELVKQLEARGVKPYRGRP